MDIIITEESISAYRVILNNPQKYLLDFPSVTEAFVKTETATAKHIVYKQYLELIGRTKDKLPKIMFYIIMDEIFSQKVAEDGNIGYCVRIVESTREPIPKPTFPADRIENWNN